MSAKIQKWGNSLGVRIPKILAEQAHLKENSEVEILHQDGKIVTSGGRVICATALGNSLKDALNKSRNLVEQVKFEDKYFRKDIGFEFL